MESAFKSKISNRVIRSDVEEESKNNATDTVSNSLTNYLGYTDSANRKTTAHAFMTSLKEKFKPISILAKSLNYRFAKVGKLNIFWFFSKIKKYADKISDKHHLMDEDSPFHTTEYLTSEEANQLSIVELELLTHVDELILLLKTETEEESLKEIEKIVPEIKEKFERLDIYLDMRFELIKSYSDRQNSISDGLSSLNSEISKLKSDNSIFKLIRKLEDKYSDFPLIYIELLETFHKHIDQYRHRVDSTDEYDKAVFDYFNEYKRITEILNSMSKSDVFKNYEQIKLEELLDWSKSIIDICTKLNSIKKIEQTENT